MPSNRTASSRIRTGHCQHLTTRVETKPILEPWTTVRPVTTTLVQLVTTTITKIQWQPYSTSTGSSTEEGERTRVTVVSTTQLIVGSGTAVASSATFTGVTPPTVGKESPQAALVSGAGNLTSEIGFLGILVGILAVIL